MILRLWRGLVRPSAEAELLERLRALIPRLRAAELPLDFTYGFRHESARTVFLTISTWPDVRSIEVATDGDIETTVHGVGLDDVIESQRADTFEQVPPVSERLDEGDGRVIGVVTGRVIPGHEAVVHSMIDHSAQAALRAGGLAAHVGRRLVGEQVAVAVVVVWPKRDTMARFVRSRDVPAVDPAFTSHLSDWRFETYNAVAPERLLLPSEGPAVVIVDGEGRYVDVTSGVEPVLGVPGELLYGRSLLDLADGEARRADLRRRFLETGVSHGTIEVLRPDGERRRLRYRSVADVPAPGLRASVFSDPEDAVDPRPTAEIVAEALGQPVRTRPARPVVAESAAPASSAPAR